MDAEGMEAGYLQRQPGLEAAQGFEPVVLVAAGCFEASKELGLVMALPEAVQQPVEPIMALEGVVELEDRFNDSFLLIKQDEVGVALTDIDAEEVARHSLGGWLLVQACGQSNQSCVCGVGGPRWSRAPGYSPILVLAGGRNSGTGSWPKTGTSSPTSMGVLSQKGNSLVSTFNIQEQSRAVLRGRATFFTDLFSSGP